MTEFVEYFNQSDSGFYLIGRFNRSYRNIIPDQAIIPDSIHTFT